jgi:glycine/D-amino acid oxidase-like deaminating enzyme
MGKRASQERWAEAASRFGVETVMLDRRQVAAMLPGLGPAHPVGGGMWTSTDGTADPEVKSCLNCAIAQLHCCSIASSKLESVSQICALVGQRVTEGFAQAAAARGARFLLGHDVVSLSTAEHGRHGRGMHMAGKVDGVRLDGGETIHASTVVVAVAGWSDDLLRRSVGLSLPILRLHATAGRTERLRDEDGAFPAVGVWIPQPPEAFLPHSCPHPAC